VAPIVWYREAWEEQQALIGPDPWEYGWTERNRNNFDTLIGYSHEQGLIKRRFQIEDLFTPIDQGRKRGIERM
jgi:4,5-dihydroxyphthalate decarboxylase